MSYELITVENGDVLGRFESRSEAEQFLRGYVDAYRSSRPDVVSEVGLIEIEEGDHTRPGELLLYDDLTGQAMPAEGRSAASLESQAPRVLLVDSHDLFRVGLRRLLEEHGVKVVGDAPNAA